MKSGRLLFFVAMLAIGPVHADDQPLAKEIDAYLESAVKDKKFSGVVLVAKDGKPIVRKAYGYADWAAKTPNTPETRFMIFSVTKQFTVAAVLRLQDHGKLSLDDPISRYVEHWPNEWASVSLHHLLSHTAGIDIDTLYFWLVKHHPRFWEETKVAPPPYEPKPLVTEPGKTSRYSNAGFSVLSMVVEKVHGKPFPVGLRELVFAPLQMNDTDSDQLTPTKPRAKGHRMEGGKLEPSEQKTHYIVGAGDVVSTADDMLKWNNALEGGDFLSARARESMFAVHVQGSKWSYGYGWQLRKDAAGRTFHLFGGSGAGFRCSIIREPHSKLFIMVLGNIASDGEFPYGTEIMKLCEQHSR